MNKVLRATQCYQATVLLKATQRRNFSGGFKDSRFLMGVISLFSLHFLDNKEQKIRINLVKMKTVKPVMVASYKQFQMKATNFQVENTNTLFVLVNLRWS